MIVHGCLLSKGHGYCTVVTFRVRFIVFTSLTLIILFVFLYRISCSHPATVFQ